MNTSYAITIQRNDQYEIDRIISIPDIVDPSEQCEENETAFKVSASVRDDTHYIKASTGKANLRPDTTCSLTLTELPADGQTTTQLKQIKPNTQIEITGPASDSFEASGGEELSFSIPGEYTITATAPFPAKPTTITVTAT